MNLKEERQLECIEKRQIPKKGISIRARIGDTVEDDEFNFSSSSYQKKMGKNPLGQNWDQMTWTDGRELDLSICNESRSDGDPRTVKSPKESKEKGC